MKKLNKPRINRFALYMLGIIILMAAGDIRMFQQEAQNQSFMLVAGYVLVLGCVVALMELWAKHNVNIK